MDDTNTYPEPPAPLGTWTRGLPRARDRPRVTSQPNPDALERACDRIWDQIEYLFARRRELLELGASRSATESEELAELWPEIERLRAYSCFYREILRWEANRRAGLAVTPRLILAPL